MKKQTKLWYESKTVLFNILSTIVMVASFVGDVHESVSAVTVMVAGIGNIILRVWFTDKEVAKTLK